MPHLQDALTNAKSCQATYGRRLFCLEPCQHEHLAQKPKKQNSSCVGFKIYAMAKPVPGQIELVRESQGDDGDRSKAQNSIFDQACLLARIPAERSPL